MSPRNYLRIFTSLGKPVSEGTARPEDGGRKLIENAERKFLEDAMKASPVAYLLSNNQSPSDDEVQIVRAHMAGISEDIEGLLTLSKSSETQRRRMATLRWAYARHACVLSPMRSLPTEILQQVLRFALAPHQQSGDPSFGIATCLPIAYLTVCRRWHDISLSSPEMWSILPPIPFSKPFTREPWFLVQLKKVVQLSKDSPLSFHMYEDGPIPTYPAFTHPAIDILVEHTERWYFASFRIFPHNISPALSGIRGRLLTLEKLQLADPSHIGSLQYYNLSHDEDRPPCDLFEGAPRLRHCQIGIFEEHLPVSFALCPVQTYLYPSLPLPPQILPRLLAFAGTLEMMSLNCSFRADTAVTYPCVELPALRQLQVSFSITDYSTSYIQFLTAPALEAVSFKSILPKHIPQVIQMLERSGRPATLHTLGLYGSRPRESFRPILEAIPSLTVLEIWLPPFDDIRGLLESSRPRYSPPLLPYLQTLIVHFDGKSRNIASDYHAVNLLVQERSEMLKKIRSAQEGIVPGGRKGRGFEMEIQLPTTLRSAGELLGCYRPRFDLEGWTGAASHPDAKMVEALALARRLEDIIPQVALGDAQQLEAQFMMAPESILRPIFKDIEAFEVDPRALFASKLVYYVRILQGLSLRPEISQKQLIVALITRILEKWVPVLAEYSRQKCRWFVTTWGNVTFLDDDDERRKTESDEDMIGVINSVISSPTLDFAHGIF